MDESRATMLRLLSGYWFSQTLYVLAELRIADRLRDGDRGAEELAAEAGADVDALYRLLRGLAGASILRELPGKRFANTALSSTLDSEGRDSLHPLALLGGHALHWAAWGGLLEAVRRGRDAQQPRSSEAWFDGLSAEPALLASVHLILERVAPTSRAFLEPLSLERFARITDVGGGFGELARAVARLCPEAKVAVFDRPEVVSAAPLPAGIERIGGDFFASWPDADAYLLRFVLHDWDDAHAARLLERCAHAMQSDSRLFVIESVLVDDEAPSIAKTHDVNMLALTSGRERTLAEYDALLRGAQLKCVRHLRAAHGGPDVLEVMKVRGRGEEGKLNTERALD
jgi:hypothetical protein